MAKLTNKQHEEQQDRRIKKLENDIKQQKDTINKLVKRAKDGDVLNDKWKRKISLLEIRKKKNKKIYHHLMYCGKPVQVCLCFTNSSGSSNH